MSTMSKYLLNVLKESGTYKSSMSPRSGSPVLVLKNFMVDSCGHIYWSEYDRPPANAAKTTILGVGDSARCSAYLNISDRSKPVRRSHPFCMPWSKIGTWTMPADCILDNSPLHKCFESMFLQMMSEVDRGFNVFLGDELLFKKNTAYQHFMSIDMLDAVE